LPLFITNMPRATSPIALPAIGVALLVSFVSASNFWCYNCSSAQSGCGPPLDVRTQHWKYCSGVPVYEQMCVKIIEKVNDQITITRGCLSDLLLTTQIRLDIPRVRRHGYCLYSVSNQRYLHQHLRGSELALWAMGMLRPETEMYKLYCFCDDWPGCNSTSTPHLSLLLFTITAVLLLDPFPSL
uniref:Protein quiver n=1 Tax=Hydatigena taeniaeformis TaxID=6205 RepID=A0A0R3WW17_HYDTA